MDGPGVRTILFVQGCKLHCDGCHNPITWDLDGGKLVAIDDIIADLEEKCLNKKITISGGEPLLQYQEILELVKDLKMKGFEIALYTGFEFDEVPKELLNCLDYIKVGKYIKEKRTTITQYVGSTNQRFIDLRER